MSRESKFQTILIHFWLCVCHILRSTWLCHSHLHVRPAAHWRPALPHVGLAADEEATERMRKGWQIRTNHDKSAKTLITIPKPNKTWRVVTLSSKQVLKLPRSTESLGISERILYNILYWFRLGTSSSSTGLVTYLSENFFASWSWSRGVVESWSRGVWTQNTSGRRRSCALSQKRKRSESWSILSWYSSPLSSGTWHQSGWSSAMQSSIFAHLGTSWHTLCTSSFTSTLDSTLHCLLPICFECLCDTSYAIVCTSSCRDMSKHVEAPLRWGCPEVLHKLLHLRWQLVDSSCSCFLMFL